VRRTDDEDFEPAVNRGFTRLLSAERDHAAFSIRKRIRSIDVTKPNSARITTRLQSRRRCRVHRYRTTGVVRPRL